MLRFGSNFIIANICSLFYNQLWVIMGGGVDSLTSVKQRPGLDDLSKIGA